MIHFVTLGFCRPQIVADALVLLSRTTRIPAAEAHVRHVFSCAYPLPNIKENRDELARIARFHGVVYHELEQNLGVSGNYNQAHSALELAPGDIVAYWDPDSAPKTATWLMNAIKVLRATGGSYVSLSRPIPDAAQLTPELLIDGVRCKRLVRACGWPMGVWSADFIRAANLFHGGNTQPKAYGYYEDWLLEQFQRSGMPGYIMLDEVDEGFDIIQRGFDLEYIQWKIASAHLHTELHFLPWLQQFYPQKYSLAVS